MTAFEYQVIDLLAHQAPAPGGLGKQPVATRRQHRRRGLLVAVLEHGVGDAQLDRRPALAEFAALAAVAVHRHVRGVGVAIAAVQLETQIAIGIHTHAHGALGEARGVVEQEGLGPAARIATVARFSAMAVAFVLAQVVIVAQQQGQVTVFDEALGVGLLAGQGGAGKEQAGHAEQPGALAGKGGKQR